MSVPTAFRSAGPRARAALLVGAGFGSGFSGFAPGTAGSVAAMALVWVLGAVTQLHAGITLAVLAVITTLACMPLGAAVERITGQKDPGFFVLDEFAGCFVSLCRLSGDWPEVREIAFAFLLFRVFDVLKPQPCRWLQSLGGGPGIVLDDVAAGVYALLGVAVFRDVVQNPPW